MPKRKVENDMLVRPKSNVTDGINFARRPRFANSGNNSGFKTKTLEVNKHVGTFKPDEETVYS